MTETSPPPERGPDFVDKALGSLDHVLDVVHDKVLRPILLAGRTVAFIFVLLLVTLALVIVLVIGIVRLMDVYLFAGRVWITYVLVGVVSLALGFLIWRRRRPAPVRSTSHD